MFRLLSTALAILLAAPASRAATDAERKGCFEARGDKRINACTPVIADPKTAPADLVRALYIRAWHFIDRRQYESAIADLDKAIALQPNDPGAFNRRGYAKLEIGLITQAMADLDRAIAIDAQYAPAYNNRGNAYRARGELERALADYRRALEIEPNFLWPMRNRAQTFERMGLFAEAEAAYQQVLKAPGRKDNSEDARAKRDAENDLRRLANILVARSRASQQLDRKVALVIGNTLYRGNFDALGTPSADARAVAAALKRLGFKEEDVHERHDLDRKAMIGALRAFEEKVRASDLALVFFAGHGIRARNNLDYLIPIDANIVSERDLADEAVALERVVERLNDAKKLQVVIFDACRDNQLSRRLYASSEATRSGTASPAPFEGPGLILAFSARRGQQANDGIKHSPFVEALLARLDRPGIDAETLLGEVAEHVKRLTGERQSPEIFGLSYGRGLVLVPASR